ncbi:hypothetical protein N7509_002632 [Penicillium cosmopolitanum]|uniref:Transcription factor domain-containing protein n=1 Tax=Penicillium cosmopolitanum TaxID=1131564 RepID=A0A9X0BDN6_9EURO|nr:uncharacterized protein N7509_002632 [Penicillium cosmopolitanum]KAJ5408749.1 hypothetical protein N7509_002632 [Penicillium cosmopolitanum]
MSTALGSNLISGSIDASLAEVDTRSRDPDRHLNHDIVIGPFAVLDFTGSASEPPAEEDSTTRQENEPAPIDPLPVGDSIDAIIPPEILDSSPVSMIDSLSQMDDFLHWSDLLSFSPDQAGFATHPTLTMPNDLSFDLTNDALLLQNFAHGPDEPMQRMTPQQTPMEMGPMEADVLKDAQFLLKHFQDIVIPQIMAIPFGQKSPWKILNLPAAVVAFGDTTFLGTEGISHARLANLYGLLACAAIDLALKPPSDPTQSAEPWFQIASQTYQKAKDHIQTSLQHETQGPKKAKYKDQLMAANILTQYAVSFFVSCQRLLRLRGLSKRRISKKARLLHHVYTWLRIVGESTFVLHDYSLSYSCLASLGSLPRSHTSSLANSNNAIVPNEPNSKLDDFLRLENQNSDSDLNIDEPKDRASGFHDIHLHDSRSFPETLYKQIYGIPETWLSLVSQTTRLANVLTTFLVARNLGRNVSLEAWECIQRRATRLENLICSFNLGLARGKVTDLQATSKPHAHMLEALNSALVIFFYRRIREAHPAVLQGHVDSVIYALEECKASLLEDGPTGPGTAWPAFIAGCEALTTSRRNAIMQWLNDASSTCGYASFATARDIMVKSWQRQDEHLAANRGDSMPSWIDIVKEEQIWPLFC